MKLWFIFQTANDDYDTFDSAVVAAETEQDARLIHPGGILKLPGEEHDYSYRTWVTDPSLVTARHIGEAAEGIQAGEVICSSFNAG